MLERSSLQYVGKGLLRSEKKKVKHDGNVWLNRCGESERSKGKRKTIAKGYAFSPISMFYLLFSERTVSFWRCGTIFPFWFYFFHNKPKVI